MFAKLELYSFNSWCTWQHNPTSHNRNLRALSGGKKVVLWSDFKRNQKYSVMKLIFGKGKVTVYREQKIYFQRIVNGEGYKKVVPDGRTNKWENKLYHSLEFYMAIYHLMGCNLIKINELSKSSWGHGERCAFSKSFCLSHTLVLTMLCVFLL